MKLENQKLKKILAKKPLNKYMDYTLLKADATSCHIQKLCEEAKKYDFFSVCVNPLWVSFAKKELEGADVKVGVVVGFPLGANTTRVKVLETKDAIENGASEIDMVTNIGMVKTGNLDYCKKEIEEIARLCHERGLLLKVILETCLLTKDEIALASECALISGADFIKTSTGFSTGGAKIEDIKIMKVATDKLGFGQIKASGGIRSFADALSMIEAGASRLGVSAGVEIMREYEDIGGSPN